MIVASNQSVDVIDVAAVGRASRLFAAAFMDDPLMRFALPGHRRRYRAVEWLFARNIQYGLRYGTVLATPGVEAASIWLGPESTAMTIGRELRIGMVSAPLKLGIKGLLRLRAYDALRVQLHEQSVSGPHLYLLAVAVHPAAQGQGLARTVLCPMLDRADASGLPCYLETTNERNLTLFRRYGFAPVLHERVVRLGRRVDVWSMLREPRAPRQGSVELQAAGVPH